MDKDMKKLIKAAEGQGFEIRYSTKGHPLIYKNGRRVATVAGTASDWRSYRNTISQLRAAGFEWPPRR